MLPPAVVGSGIDSDGSSDAEGHDDDPENAEDENSAEDEPENAEGENSAEDDNAEDDNENAYMPTDYGSHADGKVQDTMTIFPQD